MTPVARLLLHVGAFAAVRAVLAAVALATAVWAVFAAIGGTAAARFAGWRCGRTSAGITCHAGGDDARRQQKTAK